MNFVRAIRWPSTLLLALFVSSAVLANDAPDTPRAKDYKVEMRDGVKLATTVYLPEGEGPWPAILTRTPYDKSRYAARTERYTRAGYAYVLQDSRGKFASEGDYFPFESDMPDGYDTIEWVAGKDFCNGKVGMSGVSAMGIASNLAAAATPPHLVAAFVVVAPQSLFSESRFIGGVFKDSHAGGWMRSQGAGDQIPAMKKRVIMDEHWKAVDFIHHRHKIYIPIYNVGGWYDIFSQGNISNFMYLQDEGLPGARGNQKLLMGPFGHGKMSGDLEYPNGGGLSTFGDEEIRWFDHWLKGKDNGVMDEPPVRYYMMAGAKKGAASPKNQYVTTAKWPPESKTVRYYLHEGLAVNTEPPVMSESSTSYVFDPQDPVPTIGGANLNLPKGPMDQRAVGQRDDYLRFQTEPLDEDIVVAGKINVELFASTDGPDTDFMIKLVDVYPDGYEAIIVDNPLRTRYRFGRNAKDVKPMQPGVPEKLTIDLWSTAITFEKGHRIAVHISSSNYPRFEINPNTGEAPGESTMPPRVATNTIYHDSERPTAILLPIVAPGTL